MTTFSMRSISNALIVSVIGVLLFSDKVSMQQDVKFQPSSNSTAVYRTPDFAKCNMMALTAGALCCVNSPLMYTTDVQSTNPVLGKSINSYIDDVLKERVAYLLSDKARFSAWLDPNYDPNIVFSSTGILEITLLPCYTSRRVSSGVFQFDRNTRTPIQNSFVEFFPDARYDKCHKSGDTVRLGPFQAGTAVGFYLSQTTDCPSTTNMTTAAQCVQNRTFPDPSVTDLHKCYSDRQCVIDPNIRRTGSNKGNYYYSVDSLNSGKTRVLAMLYHAGLDAYILGFEDGVSGDKDFNDVVLMVKVISQSATTAPIQIQNVARVCSPECNYASGVCDFKTGTCVCTPGFFGATCGSIDCSLSPCGAQGTCDQLNNRCVCKTGWKGTLCEVEPCPGGCGSGTCNEVTRICKCPAGLTGPSCNLIDCIGGCLNGGTCNLGTCQCQSGFNGVNCEIMSNGTIGGSTSGGSSTGSGTSESGTSGSGTSGSGTSESVTGNEINASTGGSTAGSSTNDGTSSGGDGGVEEIGGAGIFDGSVKTSKSPTAEAQKAQVSQAQSAPSSGGIATGGAIGAVAICFMAAAAMYMVRQNKVASVLQQFQGGKVTAMNSPLYKDKNIEIDNPLYQSSDRASNMLQKSVASTEV